MPSAQPFEIKNHLDTYSIIVAEEKWDSKLTCVSKYSTGKTGMIMRRSRACHDYKDINIVKKNDN